MDWKAADQVFLAELDETLTHASLRAGAHLVCKPGCADCCRGIFPINRLDASRLRIGLRELAERDPGRTARIVARAERVVAEVRPDWPGDERLGVLSEDEAARDAFVEKFADLPCPVLDPVTLRCELYAHRPVSCRTCGPPMTFGDDKVSPCRLCFTKASADEIETCRVEPDPDNLEHAILSELLEAGGEDSETTVAHAIVKAGISGSRTMTEIDNMAEFEEVSHLPLAVVFKHSPRCPISRSARTELERFAEEVPSVPVFLIDVIRNSSLSQSIARKTGVRHESPQTIVLREGVVIWHASHYEVSKASLRENLSA